MYSPSRGAIPTPPVSGTSASILDSVSARSQANHATANVPANIQTHATDSLSGAVHVITNEPSFRSFLNTHKAAVAFFTSSTCGPCRMIEPVFRELAQTKGVKSQGSVRNGAGFAKIDIGVGLGRTLASQWRVTATPTFMFFLDGTKVQEIKGADSAELKTQVDLLLFQAYPPHPHTNLLLPFIQKISFDPILFTRVPAIDAVIAKLDAFIDSTLWPDHDKTQVKALINDTVSPYFRARLTTGGKLQGQFPSATSAMLSSWSQASRKLIDALPTESLFPMIDLWRLLVLDPAAETWMASQPNFDQHPLSLLLAGIDNTIASTSRNYILTALRLFANVFASPLIALKLVLGPQRQKLTAFIIQTLLHDDVMVKNASASLIFNYSAALQRNRVESTIGTTMQSKSIQIDEDEDWEVEIVSAIIEALKREEESEDFVHRLTAALAFIVRLSPFWSSIQSVLQVLQCKEVLESKLSGSGWSKSGGVGQGARKIIQEVISLVSH
ncbi:hypothetical protein AX14_013405 [Amanita brunnescens Koide BX004]|nr:hypothetical protein AX14_013405 [Amanita brunnescens Koide BX004]